MVVVAATPSPIPLSVPHASPGREESLARYHGGEDGKLARNAALVEAHGYGRLTRVKEIMDFARRCRFSRLGVAFCIGLQREAGVVCRVLRAGGFSVDLVVCKNAALPKEELGLRDEDKVSPGEFESMCNPIGQARALARAGTDLNVCWVCASGTTACS